MRYTSSSRLVLNKFPHLRTGRRFTSGVCLAGVLFIAVLSLSGQESTSKLAEPQRQMRVVVDGSKNPELIPDAAAIRALMFSMTMAMERDSAHAIDANIKNIGLNSVDADSLRREVTALQGRFADAHQASPQEPAQRTVKAANTIQARTALALDSYARLLQVLSPSGAAKLRSQITQMKREMKSVAFTAR